MNWIMWIYKNLGVDDNQAEALTESMFFAIMETSFYLLSATRR